ncbi:hypothetical protein GCM10010346_65140 [Streptomyces chryseus]|uniref:Secreted protein n=1 Tax=Streptomyces chryseus TaxID=68186 RepID=A0ABQ3EBW1_9ACTN|nr:hypothetical protein GCM10010346_65140 [Streptomyces chryseus]
MQKAAAISTVSWMSLSSAPSARAAATASSDTGRACCLASAAIRSRARSRGVTGALSPAHTALTVSRPPSSWAAAAAPCVSAQKGMLFRWETYAAISSRSPRLREAGSRSSTLAR